MKNIHLIPTDKPSRLYSSYGMLEDLSYGKTFTVVSEEIAKINLHKDLKEYQVKLIEANWKSENIYITSDEFKVFEWYYHTKYHHVVKSTAIPNMDMFKAGCRRVILTTDQDLIENGVQPIPDEFLKWFCDNSSCEEVEVQKVEHLTNMPYRIILPKEKLSKDEIDRFFVDMVCNLKKEPKQETIEEASEILVRQHPDFEVEGFSEYQNGRFNGIIEGVNYQKEKMFSEEEVKHLIRQACHHSGVSIFHGFEKWFNKFKKK